MEEHRPSASGFLCSLSRGASRKSKSSLVQTGRTKINSAQVHRRILLHAAREFRAQDEGKVYLHPTGVVSHLIDEHLHRFRDLCCAYSTSTQTTVEAKTESSSALPFLPRFLVSYQISIPSLRVKL